MSNIDELNFLRNQIVQYKNSSFVESALLFSETLLNSVQDSPKDFYVHVDLLFKDNQFKRAIDFLKRNKLYEKYLNFRIIYGRCHFAIKESVEALGILDVASIANNGFDVTERELFGKSLNQLLSECYLLTGQIHEAIENRDAAIEFFRRAVLVYVVNCDAVYRLHSCCAMTQQQAHLFIDQLDWSQCPLPSVAAFLRSIYIDMFRTKCDTGEEQQQPAQKHQTSLKNWKLRKIATATRYFHNSFFKKAETLLKSVISLDPYNPDCVVLYASVLKEIKRKDDLHMYAYNMMHSFPQKKESWFALGCYNWLISKPDQAVKNFNKALEYDKEFGSAWLALGHIYSSQSQRDQALRSYVYASAALKGSHLPGLFIALEYSMSRNIDLANKFLTQAFDCGQYDPYFWHERGFIEYNSQQYKSALECFIRARDMKKENQAITKFWEPLLSNIGHCYYKLGEYEKALDSLENARHRCPGSPSLACTIALVKARLGRMSDAQVELDGFMSKNPDHLFASALIQALANVRYKYRALNPALDMEFDADDLVRESSSKMTVINTDDKCSSVTITDISETKQPPASSSSTVTYSGPNMDVN